MDAIVKIWMPYKFHCLNECLSACHGQGRHYTNIKRKDTGIAQAFAAKFMEEHGELTYPLTGCYDVSIDWVMGDCKHDRDNQAFAIKFILDGLVKAGLIANDNQRYIHNISHKFETNKTAIDSAYIQLSLHE